MLGVPGLGTARGCLIVQLAHLTVFGDERQILMEEFFRDKTNRNHSLCWQETGLAFETSNTNIVEVAYNAFGFEELPHGSQLR